MTAATMDGADEAAPPLDDTPPLSIWIGFFAMVLGNFIAHLDVQIVASSIAAIQSGVSASRDEVSWVQTSYLIAEVIGIPLCGFLGRALGTRLLFCLSAATFTIASMLCAFAWDIHSLTVFRALQGFCGAAMIPTTMALQFVVFPKRLQGVVTAIGGLFMMMGSTMGPSVGGLVADTLGWRALFWINLAPGVICTILVWRCMNLRDGNMSLMRRIDVAGLLGLALFLGCTQYILEEGASHNWFASGALTSCAAIAAAGAMVFFYRAARAENPIVDLRVFRTPTFSIGVTLGFILGVCVFSTLFLQPLFLASVRGYSPLQVGETMFVQGATMLFAAPVIGYTMRYIRDTRPFGVLGFLLVAASCWLQAHMTADWGLEQLTWPQILRGIGLQFSFNAIMLPAISNLPPDLVHTGSGVFNTIRNIGGAFGIAILSTMQKYDIEAHRQQLYAALDPNNPHVTQMISGIEAYVERFGSAAPDRQALMYYASILDREAMVMTFNNQFLFLAIVLVIFTPAMLLLKPPPATIRVDAHG